MSSSPFTTLVLCETAQLVNVCMVGNGGLKLGTILQTCPHKSWGREIITSFDLMAILFLTHTRKPLAFFTKTVRCWFLFNLPARRRPPGLFLKKIASQLVGPQHVVSSLSRCISGTFTFAFVGLHAVSASPFFQLVKVSLNSSPTLPNIMSSADLLSSSSPRPFCHSPSPTEPNSCTWSCQSPSREYYFLQATPCRLFWSSLISTDEVLCSPQTNKLIIGRERKRNTTFE